MEGPPNDEANLVVHQAADEGGYVEERHAKDEDVFVAKDVTETTARHEEAAKLDEKDDA